MVRSYQRRRLFRLVGAFLLSQASGVRPALAAAPADHLLRATLASFLDVLLPRDALSGSATDLQVDTQLWELLQTDTRFFRLVTVGCQWLNMTGGPPFSRLSAQQQITVVEWMSNSDWQEIPRRFYELVRQAAVELYYSQVGAWGGLSISHAPQPVGFAPPWA